MRLVWSPEAWDDYCWWLAQDRKVALRINALLRDIGRQGNDGIGKPERLRHDLAGFWSRRITHEHRLVYRLDEGDILIASCRYHYE